MKYQVTATHLHPDFTFFGTLVKVTEDRHDNTFYADHPKLGCGKNRRTPEDAICALFADHACHITMMKKVD